MGVMTSPASDSLKEITARLDARIQAVDEARWLSSRFARPVERDTLIVLYAFYYELARVRVAVSDQTLGNIRFQWWRDALAEMQRGDIRQHDVVLALADQVKQNRLDISHLRPLIDGLEAAFVDNQRSLEPEGALARLAALVLGVSLPQDDTMLQVAAEWAALRRSEAVHAPQLRQRVVPALRPAVAHFRLRHAWARGKRPSALQKRASILLAMLAGGV